MEYSQTKFYLNNWCNNRYNNKSYCKNLLSNFEGLENFNN